MPITKSGDRITIEYLAGDTKGNSWSNPYTMADVYAAAVANGWTGLTKIGSMYNSQYDFYITGAQTYFWAYEPNGLVVFFDFPSSRQALQTAANCYFRSGYRDTSSPYEVPTVWATSVANRSNTQFNAVYANIEIYNTIFNNMRPSINGLSTNAAKLYGIIIYYAPTFVIGAYVDMKDVFAWCGLNNASYLSIDSTIDYLPQNINLFSKFLLYGNQLINVTLKNIKFFDGNTYIKFILLNGLNRTFTLIDSNPNKYSSSQWAIWWAHYSYPTSEYTLYLKSTFYFDDIIDGVEATIKIYDKNNDKVYEAVIAESGNSTEITYVKEIGYHLYDGITGNVTVTTYEYEPFKVVIEKTGYQTLEIPNIYINYGHPTYIRGNLELLPLEISFLSFTHPSASNADGTITITASGGTQPYQYSIDGGQSWSSSNQFTGLGEGNYDVRVKDSDNNEVSGTIITLKAPQFYSDMLSGTIEEAEILTGNIEVIELHGTID